MRENNADLVRAAIGACKISGKRGIILAGCAELLEYAKQNIFVAETCDHLRLFPKCCCLVTHGGMGTLASMLRSGRPSIVTPVWWDQNFSADRVAALGTGKRGPHFGKVTGENLAKLIDEVTTIPSYGEKAAQIAEAIEAEPAADVAIAKRIHEGITRQTAETEAQRQAEEAEAEWERAAEEVARQEAELKTKAEADQKVSEFLKSHGFKGDVNSKKRSMLKSRYPLHVAVKEQNAEMVKLLLSAGADKSLKNSSGYTPAQKAEQYYLQQYSKQKKGDAKSTEVLRALGCVGCGWLVI